MRMKETNDGLLCSYLIPAHEADCNVVTSNLSHRLAKEFPYKEYHGMCNKAQLSIDMNLKDIVHHSKLEKK